MLENGWWFEETGKRVKGREKEKGKREKKRDYKGTEENMKE